MDVKEVLMCLTWVRHCLMHDVAKSTREFTVEQLNELITTLEEET